MARYHGRHASRHAAPRRSRHARSSGRARPLRGGWVRQPLAVSGVLLLGATAAAAAERGSGDAGAADAVVSATAGGVAGVQDGFVVSPQAASQATELILASEDDEARMGTERADLTAQRSLLQGKADEQARLEAERLAAERAAEQQRIAREAERAAVISNAQNDPRSVARLLLGEYGFGDGQWGCLDRLWQGESDWRWWVANPSSGAYGIPQALPGSKMASAGNDWRTNPVTQIRWGLGYIQASYGTPCNALSHWQSRYPHWY